LIAQLPHSDVTEDTKFLL